MNGGFGMKEDLTRVSNHQECSLCKRIFLTLQDLISHINTFHSNHHLSTFSSSAAAAPTAFHQYPNLNRSPNPAFPARNCFDSKNYRIDHADEQGRFLKGSPARNTNVLFGQQEKPKLMNLFRLRHRKAYIRFRFFVSLRHRDRRILRRRKAGTSRVTSTWR